jgi:uncharacterized protein YjiS (DUF1127 family)
VIGFGFLGEAMRRSQRLKSYKKARAEIESISDADLADMGLKRYQLGHVARVRALS